MESATPEKSPAEDASSIPILINQSLSTEQQKRNSEELHSTSPQKKIVKNGTPPNSSSSSDPSPSPKKVDASIMEGLKADRETRALNLSLEAALQLTLRPEAAVDSIRYIEHQSSLLNSANISELICTRLQVQTESAVQYFIGCNKRFVFEQNQSIASMYIATDLAK